MAGVAASIATPKEVIALREQAVRDVLASPLRETLIQRGVAPLPGTPEEFDRLIRTEYARWTPLINVQNRLMQ